MTWARLQWWVAESCSCLPVLQLSRNTQPTMFKPKPLTVPSVFQNLTDIAKTSGNNVSRSYACSKADAVVSNPQGRHHQEAPRGLPRE